jgi:hypothetical protein
VYADVEQLLRLAFVGEDPTTLIARGGSRLHRRLRTSIPSHASDEGKRLGGIDLIGAEACDVRVAIQALEQLDTEGLEFRAPGFHEWPAKLHDVIR